MEKIENQPDFDAIFAWKKQKSCLTWSRQVWQN